MLDDDDIVKDGEVLRVTLHMMDSAQRVVGMVGHRPGAIPLTDAERTVRTERLQARDANISQRWRNPDRTAPERSNATDARARRDQWLTNAWRRQ